MNPRLRLQNALDQQPRVRLAALPTALEAGPELPGGARLHVKRDDLTGLGMGGNKARKLEFLCGQALAEGADTLVTVGAAQSNHARVTAAAGAVLGLETHLVLGGEPGRAPVGNQLLSHTFGAHMHYPGTDSWSDLTEALDDLVVRLEAEGRRPFRIPLGGSTGVGALGFVAAWLELLEQCQTAGLRPSAIVHASSTGGTHAGLLVGNAVWTDSGEPAPDILAVDVAKESDDLAGDAVKLAQDALGLLELEVNVDRTSAELDERWTGPAYAVPTAAGDTAVGLAARGGALVLDRVYTGKAFAGLLGAAEEGRFAATDDVIFWHTGGQPAVFAPLGSPASDPAPSEREEYIA